MDDVNSTSAFLWKAAISTVESHPLITANLLLKCKEALKNTNVGVKLNKLSQTNMCQSCGNPWSRGSYHIQTKKRFKTTKINKLLKQSKSSDAKLSKFDTKILQDHEKNKANLIVHCHYCRKSTNIPIDSPPKPEKARKQPEQSHKPQKTKIKKKTKTKSTAGLRIAPNVNNRADDNVKRNEDKPKESNSTAVMMLATKSNVPKKAEKANLPKNQVQPKAVNLGHNPRGTVTKKSANLSKKQLKHITQGLQNQSKAKQSVLGAFLNSVR